MSRYELPNFTVKADSDKKYYLPGEDAEVTISADYLFGKPVQEGKVRLVQEQNRHWDFASQQWTSDESDAIEGKLDKGGKFKTKVDLSSYFKDFARPDYARFEDISFAAYVTNATTKARSRGFIFALARGRYSCMLREHQQFRIGAADLLCYKLVRGRYARFGAWDCLCRGAK